VLQLVDGVLAVAPTVSVMVDVEVFQAAAVARLSRNASAYPSALDLQGEHAKAIGALRRLVVEEPTHEEECANLMCLHIAAGQRWNALRAYAQLRTALRDELELEPGLATRRHTRRSASTRGRRATLSACPPDASQLWASYGAPITVRGITVSAGVSA
jgi:methyl coenzyme M reductase beta subunit